MQKEVRPLSREDFSHPIEWSQLLDVIEQLSAAASFDDIVATVRSAARRLLSADGITFVLRDGNLCHYLDEDAVSPLWKGQRFPLTACISGWCMLNRQTAVIPDIYVDDRIPHEAYRPTFVKSLVMTPVRVADPLAAIGAYWDRVQQVPEQTIALHQALARSTAAAIAAVTMRTSLSESEARLRVALDAGSLGSWELDTSTHKLSASKLCKANFGRSNDEEFTYDTLLNTIHPEDKSLQRDAVARALATREPFDVEYRTLCADGSVRWIEVRGRIVPDGSGRPTRMAGVTLDVTERKQREAHTRLLMQEVTHRSKNMLSVVQAIATQTATTTKAPKAFAETFRERLAALAASFDALVQQEWRGVPLQTLVRSQLAPHHDLFGSRIATSGPEVLLKPASAQYLGMALHELLTNAVKYGALSTPHGRIAVAWNVDNDRLQLNWRECDGPRVDMPSHRGFGTQMIESVVANALGGTATLDFSTEGFSWWLEADTCNALAIGEPDNGVAVNLPNGPVHSR